MNPVVIAVAITGSVPRKKDNPALPTTPAEQIESTHAAYEKGATLVHIHVRNDDESSSSDPARFQAARMSSGWFSHGSTASTPRNPATASARTQSACCTPAATAIGFAKTACKQDGRALLNGRPCASTRRSNGARVVERVR